jgi:hypothetical protein
MTSILSSTASCTISNLRQKSFVYRLWAGELALIFARSHAENLSERLGLREWLEYPQATATSTSDPACFLISFSARSSPGNLFRGQVSYA